MCHENDFRNAQLNLHLDSLFEDETEQAPTIDPELKGCEIGGGDYAYECAECDRFLIVDDPYAPFDTAEHVCQGGCHA